MIRVTAASPREPAAVALIDALSQTLAEITGDPGRSHFDPADVEQPGALFIIARDGAGQALGCGAFRPLEPAVCEIKRMFALPGTRGVGAVVLDHLERAAREMGYAEARLSTRLVNVRAVGFYERRGYARVAAYGPYVGRKESVCMARCLHPELAAGHRNA